MNMKKYIFWPLLISNTVFASDVCIISSTRTQNWSERWDVDCTTESDSKTVILDATLNEVRKKKLEIIQSLLSKGYQMVGDNSFVR